MAVGVLFSYLCHCGRGPGQTRATWGNMEATRRAPRKATKRATKRTAHKGNARQHGGNTEDSNVDDDKGSNMNGNMAMAAAAAKVTMATTAAARIAVKSPACCMLIAAC